MLYLENVVFPTEDQEWNFRMSVKRTSYTSLYPFYSLINTGLARLDFEPLTILHGGNGSGKTTALNVIAEKLGIRRSAPFNRSNFFEDYVELCRVGIEEDIPSHSRVVTSDDVFDYMLDIRSLNEGIDRKKETLYEDHLEARHSVFKLRGLDDYEELKKRTDARRMTQSSFVRSQVMDNVREQSNGESALFYFRQRIEEDALYLLDEPENSLSPTKQQELSQFIEDSARFFHCQFVIATHSPFLLAMRGAKIYDLDADPMTVRRWTELPAVRAYYDFFQAHGSEFEK